MKDGDPVCVMAQFAGIVGAKRSAVVQATFATQYRVPPASLLYPGGYAVFGEGNIKSSCSLSDGIEGIAWCEGTLNSPAARAMVVAWMLVRWHW